MSLFNNQDLYPTPQEIIELMCDGIENKKVLEPSAGTGNIIKHLKLHGCEVSYCEKSPELQKILEGQGTFLAADFLTVKPEQVSHIDCIVMNPPFSADEKHILHAWSIAPPGCRIISLCNSNTVERPSYSSRAEVVSIIERHGWKKELGDVFSKSERRTGVEVSMLFMQKPTDNYQTEFDGFFMEEEPEQQANGIMKYNSIRDLVNRYVGAVKIFDEQLSTAARLNELTESYFKGDIGFRVTSDDKEITRAEFKKKLQRAGWQWIFNELNMQRYATRGLVEDINRFVEQQTQVPFTMRNIYKMLEIIVGTHSQRMDKAALEVFDKVTKHYSDNQFGVEGWATNSHFLLTKRFIMPHVFCGNYSGGMRTNYHGWAEPIDDLQKALCQFEGVDYGTITPSWNLNDKKFGEWFEWGFFRVKGFKKGTGHFEFLDEEVWGRFNQRIAKLKGYPLFQYAKQSKHQRRQTGRTSPIFEEA